MGPIIISKREAKTPCRYRILNSPPWQGAVAVVARFFPYTPGGYGEVISQRRGSDSSFYHFDAIRNVRQLTEDSQVVTDEYQHDAWGKSLASSGSTANSQRYKGELLAYREDPEAAPAPQYALHHHHYDPQTGTFASQDPAEDDINLYRYVKNNPVNSEDPSGLEGPEKLLQSRDEARAEYDESYWNAINPLSRGNAPYVLFGSLWHGMTDRIVA